MHFFLISFGAYRKKCYLCIVILKTLNYQLTPAGSPIAFHVRGGGEDSLQLFLTTNGQI